MSGELLIVGASVRAAAWSALRAGLRPWGADLFGDTDLPPGFECIRDYPRGFLRVAARGPACPWLYTGALENHPELVERLSRRRPLWGNRSTVLRKIRSPEHVYQALHAAGLPCPAVCAADARPASGRDWLLKPCAGSAGRGIVPWRGESVPPAERYYLQEFIEGESCAALFLARAEHAELIGTTRQLVGQDWLYAKRFQYCGSVGPLALAGGTVETLRQIGHTLAAACRLRGLFGVDFILRDGAPFPVEINPRYTASVEVLELALGTSAFDLHRWACRQTSEVLKTSEVRELAAPGTAPRFVGKAILFARTGLRVPEDGPWQTGKPAGLWAVPAFADIPSARTEIAAGKPILTLFSSGESRGECEARLRQRARDLDRVLFGS